jgi:hypothetical protein
MNLLGDVHRLAAHARLAQRALDAELVLVPMTTSDNQLLFGLRQPALQSAPGSMESAAHRLQRALKLDFPHFLRRISDGARLRAGAGGIGWSSP